MDEVETFECKKHFAPTIGCKDCEKLIKVIADGCVTADKIATPFDRGIAEGFKRAIELLKSDDADKALWDPFDPTHPAQCARWLEERGPWKT